MERKEQVTQWVQNKIEKVLDEDLKSKITEENSSFDVETYVNHLIERYFNEKEIENFRKILNTSNYYDEYFFESENSSEGQNSIQYSLGFESNEYQNFTLDEIIKNLENDSEVVKIKFLRVLELSAEDVISQDLNKVLELLQRNLNKTENEEILGLILKVFQKQLKCNKNPQNICKVFTSIAEVIANQIDMYNLNVNEIEKIYDLKQEKWVSEKNSGDTKFKNSISSHYVNPEILIKLMKLLLDSQQQLRIKGMRFNENKYREIIFSFIHLLNSTTSDTPEDSKLSGLEVVSVLDPQANWCRYWSHTAAGRTLLCSALRKYKHFFIYVIEIMLKHMKTTKTNRLPSVTKGVNSFIENSQKFVVNATETVGSFKKILNRDETDEKEKPLSKNKFFNDKHISLASRGDKESNYKQNKGSNKTNTRHSEWIVKGIPSKIVNEVVFFHSVCLVSCLIQYRSGRALFPVQTPTKRRLLNVQNLSLSLIEHLDNFEYCSNDIGYTSAYQAKLLEISNDLKRLITQTNSSRVSTERQRFS